MSYRDAQGVFSQEEGSASFYVMLSTPAKEDVSFQVEVSTTEADVKSYNDKHNTMRVAVPQGVLSVDKPTITIKKGAIKSEETISVTYSDRSLIKTDDNDFLAVVKISKASNANTMLSQGQNAFYVLLDRQVLRVIPIAEANLEGLTQVDNSEITAHATNLGNGYFTDNGPKAFDGRNDHYTKFQTITQSFDVEWYDNNYLTATLKQPITFAAYQMQLVTSSVGQQVETLGLEVSTDGGKTWKFISEDTFPMDFKEQGFNIVWDNPEPIVRLYKPIEGVNAIRWHILDMLAGREQGTAAIGELKVFKK